MWAYRRGPHSRLKRRQEVEIKEKTRIRERETFMLHVIIKLYVVCSNPTHTLWGYQLRSCLCSCVLYFCCIILIGPVVSGIRISNHSPRVVS